MINGPSPPVATELAFFLALFVCVFLSPLRCSFPGSHRWLESAQQGTLAEPESAEHLSAACYLGVQDADSETNSVCRRGRAAALFSAGQPTAWAHATKVAHVECPGPRSDEPHFA